MPGSITCWIDDFKIWLLSNDINFPLSKDNFNFILQRFVTESPIGKEHKAQSTLGFINNKLVFMKFSAKSTGGLYDPYAKKNPIKELWDLQLQKFNDVAHKGVNNCKQTAGLDWCFMITEL